MSDIRYDPACWKCRHDAGKDRAGTTWQCGGHDRLELDTLRAECNTLRCAVRDLDAQLAEAQGNSDLLATRWHEKDKAAREWEQKHGEAERMTISYVKQLHKVEAQLAEAQQQLRDGYVACREVLGVETTGDLVGMIRTIHEELALRRGDAATRNQPRRDRR